jgi:hypothetical protein
MKRFTVVQWEATALFNVNATEPLRQKHKLFDIRAFRRLAQLTPSLYHAVAEWSPRKQSNPTWLGKLH